MEREVARDWGGVEPFWAGYPGKAPVSLILYNFFFLVLIHDRHCEGEELDGFVIQILPPEGFTMEE